MDHEPYRRLLGLSAERLTGDGALVFQLHGRVVLARRDERSALHGVFDRGTHAATPKNRPRLSGAAA